MLTQARELAQNAAQPAGGGPAEDACVAGAQVAARLADWGATETLQAAGLLHELVGQNHVDGATVAAVCGARVAFLCREYKTLLLDPVNPEWTGSPPVLLRVRCFMAAYRDPELGLLCAAALWHKIVGGLHGSVRRSRAAEEARLVLMPYLDMLGMRALRAVVEDQLGSADKVSTPDDVADVATATLAAQLAGVLPEAQIVRGVSTQIHNLGAAAAVPNRSPHTLRLNVLVADEESCYRALGQVQKLWTPIEGSIVDSLYAPRANGYRTLQAAVVAPLPSGKTRLTVSIAPQAQYAINEWGLAAVLQGGMDTKVAPNAWWNDAAAGYATLAAHKPGSLPERLAVFSPQGQILSFDRGCTVVDYAYYVHSDLADQCRRFLVNGRPVEPATALHHLDLVEFETDPRAPGPNRLWLQAAHTQRARTAIERYLKRQGQGSPHGQKIVEERLKALEHYYGFNLPADKVEQALLDTVRRDGFGRKEDLLTAIAAGQFAADRLFHRLFEREVLRQVDIPRETGLRNHQVHLAQCCRPRPGDDIAGRLYRRHGEIVNMTIHVRHCPQVGESDLIVLKWRLQPSLATFARIDLRGQDDVGLLGAVVMQVYSRQPRVTLHRVQAVARHGTARIQLDLHADHMSTLQEVAEALRRLPNFLISDVLLLNLPPSEQDVLTDLTDIAFYNPYSRLPVHEDAMFFGRTEERDRILAALTTNAPGIWLIGQKRVGKTSLLLHLRNHYLPERNFTPVFIDFQMIGNPGRTNVFFEVANAIFTELNGDGRIGALGAPMRSLFDAAPGLQLCEYLLGVQKVLGGRRLILLMDEFSRLTDAHLRGQLDSGFFDQWRAMMHTTLHARIGYVVVMQQKTCDNLLQLQAENPDDPSLRLMDVADRLFLRPLRQEDARRLIEWPMRNHLDYDPEMIERIARYTGGSPFLIQAFCHSLVTQLGREQRRAVAPADLEEARLGFMQPMDPTFAHMTELLKGIANHVACVLARLAYNHPQGHVAWAQLATALPNVAPDSLRVALQTLTEQDLLIQPAADSWRFSSLLFQEWLALNAT